MLAIAVAAPAGAVPSLPPNTGCDGLAVVAKLGVVEDRAAANMLAEALDTLTPGGRCLLDAGEPSSGEVPAGTRAVADRISRVYLVGGPAAIPDSWSSAVFGDAHVTRIAGGNRWETQSEVARAIVNLAHGEAVPVYRGQSGSSAELPINTNCTQHAVLAKLSVVEDRAAANMLAEALDELQTISPSARCLVDVGDPRVGRAPSASSIDEARQSAFAYVVGGSTAVPDAWLSRHFGLSSFDRVAGQDRWVTQREVAKLIIDQARSASRSGHDAGVGDAGTGGPSDD